MGSVEYKWTHPNAHDATMKGKSQEKKNLKGYLNLLYVPLTKSFREEDAGLLLQGSWNRRVQGKLGIGQCPKLVSPLCLLNNH